MYLGTNNIVEKGTNYVIKTNSISRTHSRIVGRDSDGSIDSQRHKFTHVGKIPLKVKCLGKEWKYLLYCQRLSFVTLIILLINKYK